MLLYIEKNVAEQSRILMLAVKRSYCERLDGQGSSKIDDIFFAAQP